MQNEIKNLYGRSLFVGFFLVFLFSLVLVNYYKIQVIEHDKWMKIADTQHQMVVKEPFHRGKIYCKSPNAKNDKCVAMDVLTYHLYIDPFSIKPPQKEAMIKFLNPILNKNDIKSHFYKKSRFRKVAGFLSLKQKDDIETWWKGFYRAHKLPSNSLTFVKDYKRSYPYGHLLGQVLSTVYRNRDEKTGKAIPISGIEKKFNDHLQGEVGKRFLMRSPKYAIDDARRHIAARNGSDVHLTINYQVQAICEEELKQGLEKVNAKGGWAVMMDPNNGKIIAMAQYPFFSPEKYSDYFVSKEKEEMAKPKMVTDLFEPGSIMKVLTAAIGLKANEVMIENNLSPLFCPYEMVKTDNPYFSGRTRPLKDVSFHRYLNMFLAIQKSSNIYPARMIEKILGKLGPGWYSDQLRDVFGLGQKSGIELPYESPGMVPVYGKKYANGKDQWSGPTPYSLAIGYNSMVNAMQMARAYCVFANGGYLIEPTLIEKIVSPEGNETIFEAKEKRKVLSTDICQMMMQALKYTTKVGGTSYLAAIPGYTEAGKSSTSEKIVNGVYSKDTHCSSFAGIAPANNPKFVLVIVVDEPEKKFISGFGTTHFGGKCAAPIFKEIGKRTLQILKVPYDDPHGFSRGDPRTINEESDWYKESTHLKAIYEKWNNK
ncbi:MAG: putative peptidoglycan D,D-transpeptidase PenA [Chlamydiia bacterium]|nr:putative peptidoglycan D,D-transpeptidase PenA [Chlamydiia bacterium]